MVVVACNRVPQLINRLQILSTEQLHASNHTRPVIYKLYSIVGWGAAGVGNEMANLLYNDAHKLVAFVLVPVQQVY